MFAIKRRFKNIARKFQVINNISVGGFDIKKEEFKNLFPPDAALKCVATGFKFTEGPVWFKESGFLLFSDIPADKIIKLNSNQETEIFRHPSGNSNGLTRDRQGRLIACEHGNRRITRTEKDGSITILADTYQRKKLNSPNDVVVKSDGSVYFTDPPYGIKQEEQEQPFQGVYRVLPDKEEIELIADDFICPNGLAFSPDEKNLYISDSSSYLRHIRVFDVQEDGTLTNGKFLHDMNITEPGNPDGMKTDSIGNIFCTGAKGIWVFDSQGNHLGIILTPETPTNCTWGDNDLKTLFITAGSSIYKTRVAVPGIT